VILRMIDVGGVRRLEIDRPEAAYDRGLPRGPQDIGALLVGRGAGEPRVVGGPAVEADLRRMARADRGKETAGFFRLNESAADDAMTRRQSACPGCGGPDESPPRHPLVTALVPHSGLPRAILPGPPSIAPVVRRAVRRRGSSAAPHSVAPPRAGGSWQQPREGDDGDVWA
jgi:hypothetical protein